MSKHSRLVILGMAGLLLATLPALAKIAQKVKPVSESNIRTARIEMTGSTNTAGYDIDVSSNGSSRFNGHPTGTSKDLAKKLFQDIDAAMPLTSLSVRHGMRSASFGTRIYVIYKGQRSPDLWFGGDAKTMALKADITAIIINLHDRTIPNMPRRPVKQTPRSETH